MSALRYFIAFFYIKTQRYGGAPARVDDNLV